MTRLAALLMVLLAAPAYAQEDCISLDLEESYVLRWRQTGGPATHWTAHLGEQPGEYVRVTQLGDVEEDGDIRSAVLGGLLAYRTWYVALRADGPGGETELSNELMIPPLGPLCQRPDPPFLLEIELVAKELDEIEGAVQRSRDALQRALEAVE